MSKEFKVYVGGKLLKVDTFEEARRLALGNAPVNDRKLEGIVGWSYSLGHGKCMIK